MRTFTGNWTGTGTIQNSGDLERVFLQPGEYMESEMVHMGAVTISLLQNEYRSGDSVVLKYRHADTSSGCEGASWNVYSTSFSCLGYIQLRIEAP